MTMHRVFVTGATGLLGNNLVRELVARGIRVRALVRSEEKAQKLFGRMDGIEWVQGDMADVSAFSHYLCGCDVVFHTAAFFRDNYTGGRHWDVLQQINVEGTRQLIEQAYAAGVRRFVQTSSIAVLDGNPGEWIDETHLRRVEDADDYYRSKILADERIQDFIQQYPEMQAVFLLPGWMWGPGDMGPTSSGQLVLDVLRGKLPGLTPGSFSVVDVRDVVQAHIAAAETGRSGERYLAAGRHTTLHELIPLLGRVAGVATPKREMPMWALYVFAAIQELYARITGRPVLLSLATVRLMVREAERTRFNHAKSQRELGLTFRSIEETLVDTVSWYRNQGWV